MHWRCVILSLALLVIAGAAYKAAVVEHIPIYKLGKVAREEAQSIMFQNLDVYEQHIRTGQKKTKLNIILFPEDGLYGASFHTREEIFPYLEEIPDILSSTNPVIPCAFPTETASRSPVLVKGSCLAKTYNLTVVLNMGEVQYCSSTSDPLCPADGRYQYNTLVAFSSSGELVAKYHKSHLYFEPQFDEPQVPDVVWFDSDFGVRFGMMICFDVMFEEPQFSLYYTHGVRNFLWSSWWVDMPPLITGTQTELARSLVLPSNFLASGIGLSWYNSGSGIYSNGTALKHWYNPTRTPMERLLISDVPDIPTAKPLAIPSVPILPTSTSTDPLIKIFTIQPGQNYSVSARDGKLLCSATLRVNPSSPSGEIFGLYTLFGSHNGLFPAQICAVLKCLNEECLSPVLWSTSKFDEFELSAQFGEGLAIVYPLVAQNGSTIIDPKNYVINSEFTSIKSVPEFSNFSFMNAALFGLQAQSPEEIVPTISKQDILDYFPL